MNKKSLAISLFYSVLFLALNQGVFAAAGGGVGSGGSGGGEEPSQLCDLIDIIAKAIKIIAPAAGIGFFVMLIYAGYKYIFSFGNPAGASQARSAMITALIGVVVLLLIYAIFKSLELVTGINLLDYTPENTQC